MSFCPHQEPVNIHEEQREEKSVEEEVEGDVRDRLEAGYTCGIQHFEGKPVETEPEPEMEKETQEENMINVLLSDLTVTDDKLDKKTWTSQSDSCMCWNVPSDAEAHRANVGKHIIEQVVTSSSGLQVDVELGELKLDVTDVMEEQYQNANVVVSEGCRTQNISLLLIPILYRQPLQLKCMNRWKVSDPNSDVDHNQKLKTQATPPKLANVPSSHFSFHFGLCVVKKHSLL